MKYRIRVFFARIVQMLRYYTYRIKGYDLAKTVEMERHLNLDRIIPNGIHIGENTIIASYTTISCHKLSMNRSIKPFIRKDTYIGKNCLIGVGSFIMPGITIGDNCVVGAGSVVTKSFSDNVIIAGNPAKVIRTNFSWDNETYV